MPIQITCAQCGKTISAPDKFAGKSANCPNCKNLIEIPAAVAEVEIPDFTLAAAAAAVPPEIQPRPEIGFAPPPIPAVSHGQSVRPSRYYRREPLLMRILDFSLSHYHTLSILRITWCLSLLLAAFWFVDSIVAEATGDSILSLREVFVPSFDVRADGDSSLRSAKRLFANGVVLTIFVLWIRVWLESIAVVFNTANSIHRLSDHLTRAGGDHRQS